jgi:hypothetical protein
MMPGTRLRSAARLFPCRQTIKELFQRGLAPSLSRTSPRDGSLERSMTDETPHADSSPPGGLIVPSTKVAALLDQYPELEEVLIDLAPPFRKLKNPLLRKSVAKVASLKQAATAARMPLADLINTLRRAVGQQPYQCEPTDEAASYLTAQPDWMDPANIVATIDEREATDADEMTLVTVLRAVAPSEPGQIVELITTFIPAPGIDLMKGKGLLVWSTEDETGVVRTYVSKPAEVSRPAEPPAPPPPAGRGHRR